MNNLNWSEMHAACEALDAARRSGPGRQFGYGGCADAFGGTYFGRHYEQRGLAGYVTIARALESITQAAWELLHGAATRVKAARAQSIAGKWVARYRHGAALIPVSDARCRIRAFDTHRGAAIVAGRFGSGGDVVRGDDIIAEQVARIENEARAATRTLLAARRVYDELVHAGVFVEEGDCITAGTSRGRLNATGLYWLADEQRETEFPTVEQASRFAAGASPREALGL